MAVPEYDLTRPATEGIRGGLAVGSVSIRALYRHKDGFAKDKANVVTVETVIIPADGHDASRSIIFLIGPEVGNGQCAAGAIHGLDPVTSVIVERPASNTH